VSWILKLVKTGAEGEGQVTDVMEIDRPEDLRDITTLGLTLSEAKQLLSVLQREIVAAQATIRPESRMGSAFCNSFVGNLGSRRPMKRTELVAKRTSSATAGISIPGKLWSELSRGTALKTAETIGSGRKASSAQMWSPPTQNNGAAPEGAAFFVTSAHDAQNVEFAYPRHSATRNSRAVFSFERNLSRDN
jgi:hypothetical protein